MIQTVNTPAEKNQPFRVIVVSSNHMARAGLHMILGAHPNISLVGEVSGDLNAMELVAQNKPEVILIDLDLVGVDVLNLIRKFRATAKDSHILILCGLNDGGLIREALCSGAAGVVLKIQPPAVIFAAIEGLCNHARKTLLPQSTRPALSRMSPMHFTTKEDSVAAKIITSLTSREREIITVIGEGFSNKDIADRLCISETTVRHHLTSIFSKFDVPNRQKLLIAAHQYGIVELK
jgi:DNA-binding NarL/FixJ family response regulator